MAMATTTGRVRMHTAQRYNDRIERQTEHRIAFYAANPDLIDDRLFELNREWDIERMIETHAATVSVASVLLGTIVNRKWLLLPAVLGGFLFNYTLRGWCPQLAVFRRLGFRTQSEIERERYALKAIRGDFERLQEVEGSESDSRIVRLSRRVLKAVK